MGSQLGSAWMLTVFIISSVTLGEASLPQGQNEYRPCNEEAKAQYEYLQFHGTIINLSSKQIGGTGDLSWGKWMSGGSPKFPVAVASTMQFKSQGRANSSSGTTGTIKLYAVNGGSGEFKVSFDCPYIGSNKCNLSGEISGLKWSRLSFSGSSGSRPTCTILIEDA